MINLSNLQPNRLNRVVWNKYSSSYDFLLFCSDLVNRNCNYLIIHSYKQFYLKRSPQ